MRKILNFEATFLDCASEKNRHIASLSGFFAKLSFALANHPTTTTTATTETATTATASTTTKAAAAATTATAETTTIAGSS